MLREDGPPIDLRGVRRQDDLQLLRREGGLDLGHVDVLLVEQIIQRARAAVGFARVQGRAVAAVRLEAPDAMFLFGGVRQREEVREAPRDVP